MNVKYYVRQTFPDLRYQVVSVEAAQARSMKERGEVLYTNPRQAHAVARDMNTRREGAA